jgi:hypothetical protein
MDHQNEEAAKCADGERKVIAEGKAEVLLSSARNVFYNPVQEFNRDLRYVHYWLWHWALDTGQTNFLLNVGASANIYGPNFLFFFFFLSFPPHLSHIVTANHNCCCFCTCCVSV